MEPMEGELSCPDPSVARTAYWMGFSMNLPVACHCFATVLSR